MHPDLQVISLSQQQQHSSPSLWLDGKFLFKFIFNPLSGSCVLVPMQRIGGITSSWFIQICSCSIAHHCREREREASDIWDDVQGLASRVPYESAARTMAQTRRSYEGYTVRQGLAITMVRFSPLLLMHLHLLC